MMCTAHCDVLIKSYKTIKYIGKLQERIELKRERGGACVCTFECKTAIDSFALISAAWHRNGEL